MVLVVLAFVRYVTLKQRGKPNAPVVSGTYQSVCYLHFLVYHETFIYGHDVCFCVRDFDEYTKLYDLRDHHYEVSQYFIVYCL